MFLTQSSIAVKKSPVHGYGVFATDNISKGDVIEECYVLVDKHMPVLDDYYFEVKDNSKLHALPLGYGCIYNHAPTPNADHLLDLDKLVMRVTANCDIACGEEVFISYGKDWFKGRSIQPLQTSIWYRIKKIAKRHVLLWRFALVMSLLYGLIFFAHGY